jgi:hypothetical protein
LFLRLFDFDQIATAGSSDFSQYFISANVYFSPNLFRCESVSVTLGTFGGSVMVATVYYFVL